MNRNDTYKLKFSKFNLDICLFYIRDYKKHLITSDLLLRFLIKKFYKIEDISFMRNIYGKVYLTYPNI